VFDACVVTRVSVATTRDLAKNNKGLSHHVEIFPVVTKVSPSVGSAAGSTVLTITGLGFIYKGALDDKQVRLILMSSTQPNCHFLRIAILFNTKIIARQ